MQTPQATALVLLLIAAAAPAGAQYVSPSPAAPVPGMIDDYIKTDPAFAGWDFIVNERLRYEDKTDAGTTHAGSNFDFFSNPPTTNSNEYWLTRLMPRVGYTGDLIAFVVEARSSYSIDDDRYTSTSPGKNLAEDDGPCLLYTSRCV